MEFLLSPMLIKWDDHSDNDDKESSWIECSEDDEDSIESFRFYEDTLENYGKYDGDYDLNQLGFCYEITDKEIWFYYEESLNLGPISDLMHKFFKDRELHEDSFGMAAAFTCSKPRAGEFGGVATFVTSGSVEFTDTYSWISDKKKEFKEKNKN